MVDEKGQQLGVFPVAEALAMAQARNLDLVEVAPQAVPPVCRILEYGKFIYEATKREKEARKRQKSIEIKEVRFRPKTGEHDLQVKMKRMREFLGEGAKVKVRMLFRGREISHQDLGREALLKLAQDLSDVAVVEQSPAPEGRTLLMILAPAGGKG